MSDILPDGWYDIAKNLPPGLSGALESGGRVNGNGIIPTDFHGLDFEVVPEFDLIVEHESGEETEPSAGSSTRSCGPGWRTSTSTGT